MKKNNLIPFLYILPCLLFVLIFLVIPVVYNLVIGFTSFKGLDFSQINFIGLDNYITLFTDRLFLISLKNTFIFMVLTVVFQLGIGLLMTILLEKKLPGHRVFELVYFLPAILSSVIIAFTFMQLYEPYFGTINSFLDSIGLSSFKQTWLGDPKLALYCLLAANVYQWTGMSIIYYRAGLANISKEIYESAHLDGANFWQQLFFITIPLLKYSHMTLILIGSIGTLKFFDLVYIMTQGGPAGATEFPMTYMYKRLSLESNNGLASSLAMVILIIAFILARYQMKLFKRIDT